MGAGRPREFNSVARVTRATVHPGRIGEIRGRGSTSGQVSIVSNNSPQFQTLGLVPFLGETGQTYERS
jgi:hypothetical protein